MQNPSNLNLSEASPIVHVRSGDNIVRMDRSTVEQHNADNKDNPDGAYEVLDDKSDEVKALYRPQGVQPVPAGGVAEGVTIPPIAPQGDPAKGAASFNSAMQAEPTWADPTDPNKFVMQIGSRWFVTNDKGHRFQKGQSAVGYDTQEQAQGAAAKMLGASSQPGGSGADTLAGGGASQ